MTGGATDHRGVAPWTSRILHGRRRWGGCPERLLLPYLHVDEESNQGGPVDDPDAVALCECLPLIANTAARNDDPIGSIFARHNTRELPNHAWAQPRRVLFALHERVGAAPRKDDIDASIRATSR